MKRTGSIADALAGKTDKPATVASESSTQDTANKPAEKTTLAAFNQQQLNVVWKEMAQKANDSPMLISTINKRYPLLQQGYLVQYPVQTAEEEKVMQQVKPRVLTYLKHRLRNTEIKFELIFIQEKQAYRSNASKAKEESQVNFALLLKENPDLAELRDRFNLDFE